MTIYAGTDAGSVIKHGRIADEIQALHAAGLPARAALDAARLGRPRLAGCGRHRRRRPARTSSSAPRIRGANLGTLRELRHIVLRGDVIRGERGESRVRH